MRDLWTGFCLPFRALGLIGRSRRLAVLSAICAVVTVAALLGLGLWLWGLTAPLASWILPSHEGAVTHLLWSALHWLCFLVLWAIAANTVPVLLLTPLQDPLCDATEALLGDFQPAPFSLGRTLRQTAASLGHTLVRLAWLLGGHAVLFLLNWLPGAGNLAWTVASAWWTMRWAAVEYLDAAMGRHLYPLAEVRAGLASRRMLAIGFGAAVYVLLWLPVLNAFLVPLALIGGTLLFHTLRAAGAVPPPPGNDPGSTGNKRGRSALSALEETPAGQSP